MVKAIVHGPALLMASTTPSNWEGMCKLLARTLASGDAKLGELASMLCAPLRAVHAGRLNSGDFRPELLNTKDLDEAETSSLRYATVPDNTVSEMVLQIGSSESFE